jgi:hypothetical protein
LVHSVAANAGGSCWSDLFAKQFAKRGQRLASRNALVELHRQFAGGLLELVQHRRLHGSVTALLVLETEQAGSLEHERIGVAGVRALADHDRQCFVAAVRDLVSRIPRCLESRQALRDGAPRAPAGTGEARRRILVETKGLRIGFDLQVCTQSLANSPITSSSACPEVNAWA